MDPQSTSAAANHMELRIARARYYRVDGVASLIIGIKIEQESILDKSEDLIVNVVMESYTWSADPAEWSTSIIFPSGCATVAGQGHCGAESNITYSWKGLAEAEDEAWQMWDPILETIVDTRGVPTKVQSHILGWIELQELLDTKSQHWTQYDEYTVTDEDCESQ